MRTESTNQVGVLSVGAAHVEGKDRLADELLREQVVPHRGSVVNRDAVEGETHEAVEASGQEGNARLVGDLSKNLLWEHKHC